MEPFKFAKNILCSKPVAFALGAGIGLIGLYAYSRLEEQKKLAQSQKELEEAAEALEAQEAAKENKEA